MSGFRNSEMASEISLGESWQDEKKIDQLSQHHLSLPWLLNFCWN
jgi:hypothetical protein